MNEAQAHMLSRIQDAAELAAGELERLRILKEYELGVLIKEQPDGHGPYVYVLSDAETSAQAEEE
jgi:hypothetical protein